MSLANLSNEILLQNILDLVKKEREIILEILHLLQEVEDRYLFAKLGFSSLFKYAVTSLGYSEGAAQRRISSMRLLRSMPEIEPKVESGALSLSVLSQAHTFFRQEKIKDIGIKKEILTELEGKSSREAERELIAHSANPEKALLRAKESLRPVSPNYSQLSIIVDDKLLAELQELKDLLAVRNPYMSLKEVIEFSVAHSLKHLRVKPPKEPVAAKYKACDLKKESHLEKSKASNIQQDPLTVKTLAVRIEKDSCAVKFAKANSRAAKFNMQSDSAAVKSQSSCAKKTSSALNAEPSDSVTGAPLNVPPTPATQQKFDSELSSPIKNPASKSTSSAPPTPVAYTSPEFSPPPALTSSVPPTPAVHTPSEFLSPSSTPASRKPNSRYIPIQIKRLVWLRDQNQCTYVHAETRQRCASTFNLQIDHIHPHAKGGGNSFDNLRLLCRAHNAHAAVENFGARKVNQFRFA